MNIRQNTRARRRAQPLSQRAVGDETIEREPQRRGIAGANDQARLFVNVDPGHARRHVGADHRFAAEHRFKLDNTERFLSRGRWQHQHRARVQPRQPLVVAHVAGEEDTIIDAEFARHRLEAGTERAVADNRDLGVQPAHGAEQRIESLVGNEPADEQHDRPASPLSKRRCACRDVDRGPVAIGVESVGITTHFER